MKDALINLLKDHHNFPTSCAIKEFLIGDLNMDPILSTRFGRFIMHYRSNDNGERLFFKILEKVETLPRNTSDVKMINKTNENTMEVKDTIIIDEGLNVVPSQEKIVDIPKEPCIEDLTSLIDPFLKNDVFEKFEHFNYGTLELFKTLKEPRFDMSNWNAQTLKRWNTTYRAYCQFFFDTYKTHEMTCGDLIDWWDNR